MVDSFLALRVRELMARTTPEGRRWTSRRVAEESARLGHPLTASYIQSLASAERTNPTLASLRVLAAVFGVPVTSLIEPDPDGLDEVSAALKTIRLAGPQLVLARGTGQFPPDTLRALADLLQRDREARPS